MHKEKGIFPSSLCHSISWKTPSWSLRSFLDRWSCLALLCSSSGSCLWFCQTTATLLPAQHQCNRSMWLSRWHQSLISKIWHISARLDCGWTPGSVLQTHSRFLLQSRSFVWRSTCSSDFESRMRTLDSLHALVPIHLKETQPSVQDQPRQRQTCWSFRRRSTEGSFNVSCWSWFARIEIPEIDGCKEWAASLYSSGSLSTHHPHPKMFQKHTTEHDLIINLAKIVEVAYFFDDAKSVIYL